MTGVVFSDTTGSTLGHSPDAMSSSSPHDTSHTGTDGISTAGTTRAASEASVVSPRPRRCPGHSFLVGAGVGGRSCVPSHRRSCSPCRTTRDVWTFSGGSYFPESLLFLGVAKDIV